MHFADSARNDVGFDAQGRLRFNPELPILKLDTSSHSDLTGCVNDRLEKSRLHPHVVIRQQLVRYARHNR